MAKRVNPRRRPVTQADIDREMSKHEYKALRAAFAILFTVLYDKMGFTIEQMKTAWNEVNELSREIGENRIDINDLMDVLKHEYGINLK